MQLERQREEPSQAERTDRVRDLDLDAELGPAPLPPDWKSLYTARPSIARAVTSDAGTSTANGRLPVQQQQQQERPRSLVTPAPLGDVRRQRQDSSQVAQEEMLTSLAGAEATLVEALRALVTRNFPTTEGASSSSQAALQEQGEPLVALVSDLRRASRAAADAPDSRREMKQVVPETGGSVADLTPEERVDEVRSRLEQLAPYLVSSDSEAPMAKSLSSILGCICRLQTLYRVSPSLASSHAYRATPLNTPGHETAASTSYFFPAIKSPAAQTSTSASAQGAESDVFSNLHRQAKTLQSSHLTRNGSYDSANAVTAVEQAEVELLWGRIDDMMEEVSFASRHGQHRTSLRRGAEQTLVGATPAMASDDATFGAQHHLPEYETGLPPEYGQYDGLNGKHAYDDVDEKAHADGDTLRRSTTTASRRALPASDEKMQLELDKMTSAIERLYVASPQLANQRVDAVRATLQDRQAMREAQLAKLGTAVEKLSKGRLEDQRATLAEVQSVPGSVRNGQGKMASKQSRMESLELLLDNIDKASSRSMNDQRVTMSARQQEVLRGAQQTARAAGRDLALLDSDELAFREQLLASSGKGRLTSQDASFTLGRPHQQSAPASRMSFDPASISISDMKRRSFVHVYEHDDSPASQSMRARSSSVGALPIPPPPPIPAHHHQSQTSQADKTVKKRFSVSRLLGGNQNTSTGSRKLSKGAPASTSRPSSFHGEMPLQLQYTVEELKNVGTLTLWAWDERFESTTSKSDSSAVDLAAAAREAWSFSFASPTILSVNMGSAGTSGNPHSNAHIRLPVSADPATGPNGKMDAIFKADHFELRLRTAEASQTTRSRDDLEISHPYTARDFRAHAGVQLACVACGAELANLRSVTRFNDLPSEHWAELLDAWMCHQDQTLSEELIAKGNNIWPKETQALIGSTGIVLAASNTCNWTVASDLEPTHAADGKWQAIRCATCAALVGKSSAGPRREIHEEKAYIRFAKLAVQPDSQSSMTVHPLSSHITSAMLETSLSRAIHRFVVEDEETSTPRMVLWLFNPFVRIFSNHASFAHEAPITACKILYRSSPDLDESTIDELLAGSEHDNLIYPSRVCSQLAELLEQSTTIYPRSQQRLGEWTVGWLLRR